MKKMKSVSISLSQSPLEMFLGLINQSNNVSLTKDDVQVRGPRIIENAVEEMVEIDGVETPITRNTETDVDVLSDEVKDDFVTFRYQRASLGHLFSECNPTIREVDIDEGGALSVELIVSEILRKYKLMASLEEFEYVINGGTITLSAKTDNLAYLDSANINVEASLLTRVSKKILNGFIYNHDDGGASKQLEFTQKIEYTGLDEPIHTINNDYVVACLGWADMNKSTLSVPVESGDHVTWFVSGTGQDGSKTTLAVHNDTAGSWKINVKTLKKAMRSVFGILDELNSDIKVHAEIKKASGDIVAVQAKPLVFINDLEFTFDVTPYTIPDNGVAVASLSFENLVSAGMDLTIGDVLPKKIDFYWEPGSERFVEYSHDMSSGEFRHTVSSDIMNDERCWNKGESSSRCGIIFETPIGFWEDGSNVYREEEPQPMPATMRMNVPQPIHTNDMNTPIVWDVETTEGVIDSESIEWIVCIWVDERSEWVEHIIHTGPEAPKDFTLGKLQDLLTADDVIPHSFTKYNEAALRVRYKANASDDYTRDAEVGGGDHWHNEWETHEQGMIPLRTRISPIIVDNNENVTMPADDLAQWSLEATPLPIHVTPPHKWTIELMMEDGEGNVAKKQFDKFGGGHKGGSIHTGTFPEMPLVAGKTYTVTARIFDNPMRRYGANREECWGDDFVLGSTKPFTITVTA